MHIGMTLYMQRVDMETVKGIKTKTKKEKKEKIS